jgi:hypothetical protein
MLGKMSRLEVHHIFPKSQLYKREYKLGVVQKGALAKVAAASVVSKSSDNMGFLL